VDVGCVEEDHVETVPSRVSVSQAELCTLGLHCGSRMNAKLCSRKDYFFERHE
jgi:hypothetical protein